MMEVPESVLVNTGDQEGIYRQIDDFFNLVRKEIEARTDASGRPSEFERRVNNLLKQSPTLIPLDDTVHLLMYKERVVAVVTETRTEANYVQFDFFRKR